MNANQINYEQAIENVEEAQELLQQAVELLENAVKLTNDRNAEAYLVDHLKIMISDDHGFLSRDLNCDTWIERLEDRMQEMREGLYGEEDEEEFETA